MKSKKAQGQGQEIVPDESQREKKSEWIAQVRKILENNFEFSEIVESVEPSVS